LYYTKHAAWNVGHPGLGLCKLIHFLQRCAKNTIFTFPPVVTLIFDPTVC